MRHKYSLKLEADFTLKKHYFSYKLSQAIERDKLLQFHQKQG